MSRRPSSDRLDRHERRLFAALDELGAATPAQLAELTGIPHKEARRALLDLHAAGVVERELDSTACLYSLHDFKEKAS
jgi:DNA-binding IclR family transcriptional regulator